VLVPQFPTDETDRFRLLGESEDGDEDCFVATRPKTFTSTDTLTNQRGRSSRLFWFTASVP